MHAFLWQKIQKDNYLLQQIMEIIDGKKTYYPKSKDAWRKWLQQNHNIESAIWMVGYTQKSGIPTLTWSEAVDQALCFGWIDSTRKSTAEGQYIQLFTKRKPKSTWSKINKDKVSQLLEANLMADAGMKAVEIAKQNGSWEILDSVEALVVPEDLKNALDLYPEATAFFNELSKSIKKMMLYWIISAKRPETRQKRIHEIAEHAALKRKPKQF